MVKIINEEVVYAESKIVLVDQVDLAELKQKSLGNKRGRIRLCAHQDVNDRIHEMIIVHAKEAYVRPHKHLNKCESLHVIEGIADMVIYDENGVISDAFRLGDDRSGHKFYCRMSEPIYHNLFIRSEHFVFHEVTSGPFDRRETVFAPWAPTEEDQPAREKYIERVKNEILRRIK
ncbi:MAG: WbuC family cupin fold metalloprotein [Candidatus Margulisiibacteriota bacterium]